MHAGGPPTNATCTFLKYSTGWYNNLVYNSTEVTCDYSSNAQMQVGQCEHLGHRVNARSQILTYTHLCGFLMYASCINSWTAGAERRANQNQSTECGF